MRTWFKVVDEVQSAIDRLRWGSFLIVDYDRDARGMDAPYAQAAPDPGGWTVEVASDNYIPHFFHDGAWLATTGWRRPAGVGNWSQRRDRPVGMGRVLVDGLRYGRGCLLPELSTVTIGRFAGPPDGGQRPGGDLAQAA